jgi:hypothetical protein
MTGMIRHAKLSLNHLRHSGERPQVCGIARCLGSPQKDLFQFLLLPRRQPSCTSWMRFGAQHLQSPFLQILLPSRNRRRRGLDQTGHLSNSPTLQEQPACHHTTCFQSLRTSFWSHSTRVLYRQTRSYRKTKVNRRRSQSAEPLPRSQVPLAYSPSEGDSSWCCKEPSVKRIHGLLSPEGNRPLCRSVASAGYHTCR